MIGHLGNRVSALLDGQLSARETEEAWTHVYTCHTCRDLVEREGWIKTRLAGLCAADGAAPSGLKGSLLSMPPHPSGPGRCLVDPDHHERRRRAMGVMFLGGGAVGAAMVGVLALGFVPGSAPPADRRPPATQLDTGLAPTDSPSDPADPRRPLPVNHGTSPATDAPSESLTPTSAPVPATIAGLMQRIH